MQASCELTVMHTPTLPSADETFSVWSPVASRPSPPCSSHTIRRPHRYDKSLQLNVLRRTAINTRPFLGNAGGVTAGRRSGLATGSTRRTGSSYSWIASSEARYSNPPGQRAPISLRTKKSVIYNMESTHQWNSGKAASLHRAGTDRASGTVAPAAARVPSAQLIRKSLPHRKRPLTLSIHL